MQPVVDSFLNGKIDVSQSMSASEITGAQLVDAYKGMK